MNLLLDTHVWLWWMLDAPQLSGQARELIETPDNRVFVSAISIWEVNIKRQGGKLEIDDDLVASSREHGLEFLAFDIQHAVEVQTLLLRHRDPFDRALLAQARSERMKFVTADAAVEGYRDQVQIVSV